MKNPFSTSCLTPSVFLLLCIVLLAVSCQDATVRFKYSTYLSASKDRINKLSPERHAKRDSFLSVLRQTETYTTAKSTAPNSRFLLVMSVISEAITYSQADSYSVETSVENQLTADEITFYRTVMSLLYHGGLPSDLICLFERHFKKYGLFGTANSGIYDKKGVVSEIMPRNFDVSPIAVILRQTHLPTLKAVLDAKQLGASKWASIRGCDNTLLRPYLSCFEAYTDYLKSVTKK